ncbi:site-specific integrase [Vibrio parahaemolyticus]|nr:site-specific integrase [Vibrio parahaemolyticus]EKL0190340.1 site-specific integrase [Vibrio parahaemolyticus]EME0149543.1 site-specific integrase [Vibrio parahaemolyticus]EME0863098.1 site-specific integrase [Vibrio parahaemolyticus]
MTKYDYKRLSNGLSIYKQVRSKNWYIRLRIGVGSNATEFVKSLKTPDEDEATKKAWSYFFAQQDNLSPDLFVKKPKSKVSYLCKELVSLLEQKPKKINKDYVRVLSNEVIKELGSKSIEDVDRADLRKYLSKYAKSTTQLRIRKTALKHMFDLAIEHKLIKEYQIPTVPTVEVESQEVRSMFSTEHLNMFDSSYDSFIDSSRKVITRRYRQLLREYSRFLLDTGVRVGEEALHIKLSDVKYYPEKKLHTITITKGKIHSKSKSSFREIPISPESVSAISNILLLIHDINIPLKSACRLSTYSGLYLFRLPEVEARPQFEKIFEQFCNHMNFNYKDFQYSLYSYRHTYITRKLVQGVDAYLLATHCGTSVEMLERNYSKLTSVMRSSELVGSWVDDRLESRRQQLEELQKEQAKAQFLLG